jgi:DNA-binding CsgD family transcriptional regulator
LVITKMPLQAFSNALYELYRLAEQFMPDEFPEQAIRIARNLIHFDGAILGTGNENAFNDTAFAIATAQVYNRDEVIGKAGVEASESDSIIGLLLHCLSRPIFKDHLMHFGQCDRGTLHEHSLHTIFLYDGQPNENTRVRWFMLYRSDNEFNELETTLVRTLWHHITHGIELNLYRALEKIDSHHATRALAFVNTHGVCEMMTNAFTDLIALEWPDQTACSLPAAVVNDLVTSRRHRATKIEITATQKFGYLACTARPIPLVHRLSPAELGVAERYAKGMTHKEIAFHLSVSPHTVRNQLARVYQKLGLRSKTELVRILDAHADNMETPAIRNKA